MTAPVSYIERIGKRHNGEPRIKTHLHHWAICDHCGEGTWVAANRLAKAKDDPRPGLKCRMTPRCPGKHRKAETDDDDHD